MQLVGIECYASVLLVELHDEQKESMGQFLLMIVERLFSGVRIHFIYIVEIQIESA